MIKFVRTFKVEFPVWVDGQPTEEKETRIKALFVREVSAFNGLKTIKQWGSMVLDREVTQEEVDKTDTEKDWSHELRFVPKEGSTYYDVRGL